MNPHYREQATKSYADIGLEGLVNTVPHAANMSLTIAGRQWLIEVLHFYYTFALTDSFVLQNTHLRKVAKRNTACCDDTAVTRHKDG